MPTGQQHSPGHTGTPDNKPDPAIQSPVISYDIFCRVVDNYGDAGVSWRLARRLAAMRQKVRLWVDRPQTLAKLLPALNADLQAQACDGVLVNSWDLAHADHAPWRGAVIETFACGLPDAYRRSLAQQQCTWVNLEYLSAQSWVESCHGLPSLQADGVSKHYFFPGFTKNTGGLLREPGLLQLRDQALTEDRRARMNRLFGPAWQHLDDITPDTLLVFLFCYPHAPIAGLQKALASLRRHVCVMVPDKAPPVLQGGGNLQVLEIPFVAQEHFDQLLWLCDLCLVRGEDSLVRAIWSGRPFVWQPYLQDDDAHIDKLQAWLELSRCPARVSELMLAWSQGEEQKFAGLLPGMLEGDGWRQWQKHSHKFSWQLARQNCLASRLHEFCLAKLQTAGKTFQNSRSPVTADKRGVVT